MHLAVKKDIFIVATSLRCVRVYSSKLNKYNRTFESSNLKIVTITIAKKQNDTRSYISVPVVWINGSSDRTLHLTKTRTSLSMLTPVSIVIAGACRTARDDNVLDA